MNDIRVVYLDLDPATKGAVVRDSEDNYIIFINSIYNYEQQREAFNHEVRHLLRGHHYLEGKTVQECEAEANAKGALLDKIKQAEANGLPLNSVLLKAAPAAKPGRDRHAESLFKIRKSQLTGML